MTEKKFKKREKKLLFWKQHNGAEGDISTRTGKRRKNEWRKGSSDWFVCLFVCLALIFFFLLFLSFPFPLDGARAKEVLQFIRFFLSLSFFASLFACRIPSHSDKNAKTHKHSRFPHIFSPLFHFSLKRNLLFFSSVCCARARARVCVCRSVSNNPPSQIYLFFFEYSKSIDDNTHTSSLCICSERDNKWDHQRLFFLLSMALFVVIIPLSLEDSPMSPIYLSHFYNCFLSSFLFF